MAILRRKEMRKLEKKDLEARVTEFQLELAKERANIEIGASVTSPGRNRELRKTIARIKTEMRNRELPSKGVAKLK